MKKKIVVVLAVFLLVFGQGCVFAKGGGAHSSSHSSAHSAHSSSHSTTSHSTVSHSTSSSHSISSDKATSHSASSSPKISVVANKAASFSEAVHGTSASTEHVAPYSQYISSRNSSWPLIMSAYYSMNSQSDDDKKDEEVNIQPQ